MIADRLNGFGRDTFASLQIRNYRLYFIGQGISMCGNWMQGISQAWLALKLSGSGTTLGLIAALQTLPVLFLGPMGGLIADRFPKRKILYATQSIAALMALLLGLLVATGAIRLWMLYVFAPCLGFINVVDNPTRQTFIMEMVGEKRLVNAVTLNSSEVNLARVIGPAIAGILIAKFGLAPCFLLNSLSFVAVLAMLFVMNASELRPTPLAPRKKGQLIEGFRYVRSTPLLRNTLMMMAVVGTFTYEFQVSLPLLAHFTFHGNAASYAALTSAMGAGAVAGGLFAAGRKTNAFPMLIRAAALFGIVVLLVSVMPSLLLATAAMLFVGVFSITFTSFGNATLQLESAPEMRGRVMSLWTVAFMGSTPIGGPIIGWVGETAGPRWSLAVGGIAALLAAGIGAIAYARERFRAEARSKRLAADGE